MGPAASFFHALNDIGRQTVFRGTYREELTPRAQTIPNALQRRAKAARPEVKQRHIDKRHRASTPIRNGEKFGEACTRNPWERPSVRKFAKMGKDIVAQALAGLAREIPGKRGDIPQEKVYAPFEGPGAASVHKACRLPVHGDGLLAV